MKKHACAFPPPSRVWYQTRSGKWASREWLPGEKDEYCKKVLGW